MAPISTEKTRDILADFLGVSHGTLAADILKWIEKGYCAMHITRKGSDLKTRYDIDPLID